MNMREVARIYGKKNDFLQYEEGRKQFYTAEDAKERQKEIKSASSSFWESDFQENMDKPDGKLKINYAAERGGDYRWIAVGGIDRILAFETKKVDMMRRGENGTPKVAESSQNFQQKKQLQALPTEIPAEQRYLSASVDELIAWQEARAQAAAQQETAFKQWIETLQMDSAGNKRPMQFRENIKPFLTLEILKDYETKRLAELKAEQSLGKDGQSGKKSLAYRIAWHLRRIETIEAGIKVRNGQSDENEKKQVEAREIEKYFKATGTDRTAEGMLSALKEGRFQNREIEERGRKGYTEYLNQQNAGLQYLYGAKTDTAASNAELINYYFRHFGEEEDKENLNQFLGGLRQNQEEGVQKENLKRYQEAKLAEQTRDDGMEYSHWEILERLKKMPRDPLEAVISAYISMGGGKEYVESDFFQVTPRALLEFEETHTHGEGWYKHNERTTKIMKERSKGLEAVANQYESMVDSSARTIFGENFYKAAILKSYVLPHLTPGFIKKREERFCAASTKDIDDRLAIISRGTAGRTPEGSDENVLLEEQQKAFKEYIDTGTRFGKRRWDWLGADSMVREKIKELAEDENYSGSAALIDYEKEKADEYKRKTENLDKPVRVLNEAIDQLTEMIGTSQEAIDDLEKIQRDPRGFFTAQDLTDNILTDVGKQYDTLEEAVNTQKPLPDSLQRNIDNLVITDEIPEIDPDQLLGL